MLPPPVPSLPGIPWMELQDYRLPATLGPASSQQRALGREVMTMAAGSSSPALSPMGRKPRLSCSEAGYRPMAARFIF